jgi:hypothetical protein
MKTHLSDSFTVSVSVKCTSAVSEDGVEGRGMSAGDDELESLKCSQRLKFCRN